jgi:hypothetical protein
MKKRKVKVNLSLNKETIAKLSDDEMNNSRGGVLSILFTFCPICNGGMTPTFLPPCP